MSNHRARINGYCHIAFVALLMFQVPHFVQGQVLPPDAVVAEKSIAEWQVLKWKWSLEAPAGMNPIEDTTGELSHTGDQGSVFFVDGTFGGPTVTRTATIRDDQHIFVGLLNSIYWIPDAPTEAELRSIARADIDTIDQLFLEIDGIAPAGVNLFDHRVTSPPGLFDIVLPENNIIEIPAGVYPGVSDGYSVMLTPLTQGSHTLAFGGRSSDAEGNETFRSSVIYNVSVVPEPSSLALVAGSLLGLVTFARKWQSFCRRS